MKEILSNIFNNYLTLYNYKRQNTYHDKDDQQINYDE